MKLNKIMIIFAIAQCLFCTIGNAETSTETQEKKVPFEVKAIQTLLEQDPVTNIEKKVSEVIAFLPMVSFKENTDSDLPGLWNKRTNCGDVMPDERCTRTVTSVGCYELTTKIAICSISIYNEDRVLLRNGWNRKAPDATESSITIDFKIDHSKEVWEVLKPVNVILAG